MKKPPNISRRQLLKASAAGLSYLFIPGTGRVRAARSGEKPRDSFCGRICFNENPVGPSPMALDAMRVAAAKSNRYPDWYSDSLERKIAETHDLPKSAICVGSGATEILRLIGDAFLESGDEMLTATPTYFQMADEALKNGADVIHVPVDQNFRIDLNTLYQAMTRKTRLISLVNPNNPLATCINRGDMEDFLYSLPEKVIVVVDEAYHHYVHTPEYESCIRYVLDGLPVIVVRTFSKAYGLAGARIGYAAAPQFYASRIGSTQLYGTVSNVSQAAALAAIADAAHVEHTVSVNDSAKQILESGLTSLGLEYIPSETNFLMFDTGINASPVAAALAARGFQVRLGWGMPQHIRVSTGYPAEMKAFIDALGDVIS